jgi:hypothetical protein
MITRRGSTLLGLLFVAGVLGACPAPQPQTTTPVATPAPPPRVTRLQMGSQGGVDQGQQAPAPVRNPELDTAVYRERALQAQTVLNFNDPSNFGGGELTSGFSPDPWGFPLTAGGGSDPVNVATLGLIDEDGGEACGQAYVARKPDFHFTFQAGQYPLVRFYVVTENGADATLLINDPSGRWRCNDDHPVRDGWGNERMPSVDFAFPETGRYDIWVGSYDQTAHNPAQLFVTEIDQNHP